MGAEPMKRLLRGVIDWGGVSPEGLVSNYHKLRTSKLEWVQAPDRRVFRFVSDFFAKQMCVPSAGVLVDFFTKTDDIEVLDRLEVIRESAPYEGANYSFVLDDLIAEQTRQRFQSLIKEAQEISQKGLTIGEGREKVRLEGVKDAVQHFQTKAADLVLPGTQTKTRGNIRREALEALADFQERQANPSHAVGQLCGIKDIDTVCKGAKAGELWLHAAYVGELKSLTALNWCYQLVTRYRTNIFFVSLEMPFKQLRNIICVMHSTHPKWAALGYEALEYRRVRDGKLNRAEMAFLKVLLEDFYSHPEYGQFEIWCPDHEVNMNDIKMEAELLGKQIELGFIVIDHGGIVQPVHNHRDFNHGLNTVIRDAKRLALHFNQGAGIATLLLFQINRQGKAEADKNEGRYRLSALSHANEAERSADVVTTSYLNDELRREGCTILCNLKNRDNPMFDPLRIGVNFATRRLTEVLPLGQGMVSDEEEILAQV
jgi:replicative DNA helicase